jgi:hypothetical protein
MIVLIICAGQKLRAGVKGHCGRRALLYFGCCPARGATVVAVPVWQYPQLAIAGSRSHGN